MDDIIRDMENFLFSMLKDLLYEKEKLSNSTTFMEKKSQSRDKDTQYMFGFT